MTKSIADLYNEVQNIANGNRRLDVAGQWEHAATPGNIPFDATNNEYMRNVEESQLKQQENRAEYIKNNYKKEVPVAAPVPGPAPIPTMKDPKMVTTPSDKKPASMREALEQVRNNVQEGEAWDATRRGAAALLRGDVGKAGQAASDWASATKNNVVGGAEKLAQYIEPKAAAAPAPKPIASTPTAPVGNGQTPAMASAPAPSSLSKTAPVKPAGPAVAQDKKPATVTSSRSSINDIAKANNIKDVNKIRAGSTIKVGGKDYTIKKGDTLTSISKGSGSAPKPSTANVVSQDKKPAFKTAPLPPRRPEQGPPIPKPNVAPSQGTSAAGGNPTPTGGYSMDRQHRNTTPNQSRTTNVAPPSGGSVPAQSSTSSTAMSRPARTDSKNQQNFLRNNLRKEETTMKNSLIDSFLRLQETNHSNMFEAAKKNKAQSEKYNNGDKDPIDDDGGKNGGVANSQAPGAVAENTQVPGHRRVAMFDPSQGYARTAGSADGAKERLEALWGAVTGEQTVHRDAGLADAIRADLAAIKEEFGDMFDNEIQAITEALEEITEAPKEKEHLLSALAAKAISKGHPVKKLPAGRAENSVLPKGMYGGGINHESGVKRQAKMRSEGVEFSAEELAHIQSVLEGNPVAGNASVEGSPSSEQAAKGTQVDKATLTDSKKRF
jgi:hypothetical protein